MDENKEAFTLKLLFLELWRRSAVVVAVVAVPVVVAVVAAPVLVFN